MNGSDGRVALVFGAGGGIGEAIVRRLLSEGAQVLAADIDLAAAQATQASAARHADVRDEAQIAQAVAASLEQFGRLDVLVNNAALQTDTQSAADGDIEGMDASAWDAAFAVNARGTMLACKHALPSMVQQGGGAIVNLASNLGLQGGIRQAAYAASKAAVMQLTRSIAASHGKKGVRCNAVAPGLILTPKALARIPTDRLRLIESETLTPTLGLPDDIARAVAFLASDAARHVNGHTLVVDGGTSSHMPGLNRPGAQGADGDAR